MSEPEDSPLAEIDKCNIFVKYLPTSLTDTGLFTLFSQFGEILSCKVMVDPVTGNSLGYGFCRFSKSDEAAKAIEQMSGQHIGNKTLLCKLSHGSAHSAAPPSDNLYIKPLLSTTSEEDLRSLFAPFGPIIDVKVMVDKNTGHSRQIGFVRFQRMEDARNALLQMNGHVLEGDDPENPHPLVIKFAEGQPQKMNRRARLLANQSAAAARRMQQQLQQQQHHLQYSVQYAGASAPSESNSSSRSGRGSKRGGRHQNSTPGYNNNNLADQDTAEDDDQDPTSSSLTATATATTTLIADTPPVAAAAAAVAPVAVPYIVSDEYGNVTLAPSQSAAVASSTSSSTTSKSNPKTFADIPEFVPSSSPIMTTYDTSQLMMDPAGIDAYGGGYYAAGYEYETTASDASGAIYYYMDPYASGYVPAGYTAPTPPPLATSYYPADMNPYGAPPVSYSSGSRGGRGHRGNGGGGSRGGGMPPSAFSGPPLGVAVPPPFAAGGFLPPIGLPGMPPVYPPLVEPTSLFVFHLPYSVDERGLRRLFEKYGRLESARVVRAKETGQSRGYGFVRYRRMSDAIQAVMNMNGFLIEGKNLKVAFKSFYPGATAGGLEGTPPLRGGGYGRRRGGGIAGRGGRHRGGGDGHGGGRYHQHHQSRYHPQGQRGNRIDSSGPETNSNPQQQTTPNSHQEQADYLVNGHDHHHQSSDSNHDGGAADETMDDDEMERDLIAAAETELMLNDGDAAVSAKATLRSSPSAGTSSAAGTTTSSASDGR